MDNGLLHILADLYKLGNPRFIDFVHVGYGSTNSIIADEKIWYLLKQYGLRRTSERVREIQAVEQLFVAQALPVVAALPNRTGDFSFRYKGHVTALFPFVTGKQYSGRLSIPAAASAGKMLARLHLAGSDYAHIIGRSLTKLDSAKFIQHAKTILARIEAVELNTPYEDLAREFVHLKMRLVRHHNIAYESGHGVDKHLLHGDYHHGNLMFNHQDCVIHILDFERVVSGPRSADLAFAIFYTCFDLMNLVDEIDENVSFSLARAFLESYQGTYPITAEELERGMRWFMLANQVYTLWPVTAHYLHEDTRADALLPKRIERCNYLVNNLSHILGSLKALAHL
jgi:homoserine kinase type II